MLRNHFASTRCSLTDRRSRLVAGGMLLHYGATMLLSIGGGLAGVMAALTQSHGTHAYVLDNMPYAVAASVAYYLASELDAAPPNASNVTQSYVTGEVLQYIRCESLRPCIGSRRLSKG